MAERRAVQLEREACSAGRHLRMPSVNVNLVLYVISGLALLKASDATLAVRVTAVPFVAMAAVYGVLLSRGPLDRPVDR